MITTKDVKKGKILKNDFFERSDVVTLSQDLIGMKLVTCIEDHQCEGIITETEAYCGLTDKACHAYLGRNTNRTQIFYKSGGLSYVYLCYGIHNLFNIIVGPKDDPKAILIRAVEPTLGLETMMARRFSNKTKKFKKKSSGASKSFNDKDSNNDSLIKNLANGPGKLTQAFGIKKMHNGLKLALKDKIWIESTGLKLKYIATPRIGIDYAGEDAKLPWRFLASNLGGKDIQRFRNA